MAISTQPIADVQEYWKPWYVSYYSRNQGARRVWADSQSRIWVSEWQSGQVSMYDPKTNKWRE
jgi:streptogramin lyase